MQALIDYVQFAFTCTVAQVSININTLQIKAVLGEKDDQPTIKVSSLFNINDCIIFFSTCNTRRSSYKSENC